MNMKQKINNVKMSVRAANAICNYNWSGDSDGKRFRTDAIVTRADLREAIERGAINKHSMKNFGAKSFSELTVIAGLDTREPIKLCKCPDCGKIFDQNRYKVYV